jgi:hypothetical protein
MVNPGLQRGLSKHGIGSSGATSVMSFVKLHVTSAQIPFLVQLMGVPST